MNLVFQALALFAFVLPGILVRWAYNQGTWKYPLGRLGPISDQVPKSLAYAVCINTVWAFFVDSLHRIWPSTIPSINYRAVVCWLSNNFGRDQSEFRNSVESLSQHPFWVLFYFMILYGFSYLLGSFGHFLVRWLAIDRKYRWFRFENDWHYQFQGEVLAFRDKDYNNPFGNPRTAISYDEYRRTVVCAVVDFRDRSCLYVGFLVDFFFDQSGNLDRILLEGVRRRDFSTDDDSSVEGSPYYHVGKFHDIKGHYFVLRMSEVKTLNFDYITDEDGRRALELAQTEKVRQRAHEIWEEWGQPLDQSLEIWCEAERELAEADRHSE